MTRVLTSGSLAAIANALRNILEYHGPARLPITLHPHPIRLASFLVLLALHQAERRDGLPWRPQRDIRFLQLVPSVRPVRTIRFPTLL